ncbi:hypothetical protein QBC39DRAFT_360067 [Podospora conica]|nr:hypothetical protein QBC39DRAFT_360067 [Schizothecium conicum]
MAGLRWLWALSLALVATLVGAQSCSSFGVDYANGGSYNIDGGSNQYFSFVTIFQGCESESISPVLVGPDGSEYACSAIRTQPAGQQVTSTCGIPYSVMRSGTWKIVVAGYQLAVQRTIRLTVGLPQTTWVTATPTVVIGVTVTAKASTVQRTLIQTQTLILVPATVSAQCQGGATRTVTSYNNAGTTTVRSTVVRTSTDGQVVTSVYQTTVTATATCHYAQKKRDAAAFAAVAAVTSTTTQTTRTVTITSQTTIPAKTTTENVLRTSTQTITPAPSTVCVGGNAGGVTITVNVGGGGQVTQTDIIYQTSHIRGTVYVGQTSYTTTTNQASATACWRAGGWFG